MNVINGRLDIGKTFIANRFASIVAAFIFQIQTKFKIIPMKEDCGSLQGLASSNRVVTIHNNGWLSLLLLYILRIACQ